MKLKTLELFGGIGAPRSALENLKVFLVDVDNWKRYFNRHY